MKTELLSSVRKKYITPLICILFLLTGVNAYTDEKPGKLLGYIVIPDIVQTLDRMEKIAAAIDPAQFKPGALKGQAGALLGDPKFENIDRTKPMVMMIFQQTPADKAAVNSRENISYAVFFPAKDKARYKKIFDNMNMPGIIKDNMLIIGNKKPAIADAQKETGLYKKITAQKLKSDIRFQLKIDTVMSAYSKEINGFTKTIQSMQEQQSQDIEQTKKNAPFIAMGKLFAYGILDIAMQSKDYQFDISLNEKSLIFSSEHSAKQGTPLNSFYDGEAPGVNKCLSLLPGKGDLTYAGYFDMKRFKVFLDSIVSGAIKKDPAVKKDLDLTLIEEYKKFLDFYLGQFAVVYGFDKSSRLEIHLAASTDRSPEDHQLMNEKFIKIYNSAIEKMGNGTAGAATYTMEKNVRKSSGYDVHKYIFKMDYSKMSEQEKNLIQKMFGEEFSMEYAVANGYIVSSTSPQVLDKIITNTKTGGSALVLQSMKTFGPGMDSYMDFDVIGLVEKIAVLSQSMESKETNPAIDDTLKMMKTLSPEDRIITASARYSKGISFNKYQISIKMITDMVKFVNEQRMRQINTGQPVYTPEQPDVNE